MKRLLAGAIAALAAVAIVACDGGGSEGGPAASPSSPTSAAPSPTSGSLSPTSPPPAPPQEKNVFQNPGLEEGRDGWTSISPPDFILSEDTAHSGQTSALLKMRARLQDEGTKVFYLVQEVAPQEFPELIAGNYRVTKWLRGTPLQYLQFAVIAFGANNLPGGFANHQIRYILAGIDKEPFDVANARFVFLSREDPPLNEWVSFQANVRDDFVKLWGDVPEYEKIRVLFEARYDDKVAGDGAPESDVYYDDLYFGPAQ